MNSLFKKDFTNPDITPQAKCPNCGKTIYLKSDSSDKTYAELISIKSILDESRRSQESSLICCSHCGGEFERARVMPSLAEYMALTKAISTAKSILTFNVAISIVGLSILLSWWFSTNIAQLDEFAIFIRIIVFSNLATCVSPLLTIFNWFMSHGFLKSNDAEFLEVKRSLKMSFGLWSAATVLTFMALKYQGWFQDLPLK